MTFVYPSFLWALWAIAIPIIIHIFNFRRYKTVYYSHTNFLKDFQIQAKSKRNIKQLLILLMRILTIVSLVIAFAKPISKNDIITKANCNSYSLYVDNSFSMNALSSAGTNIDVAKDRANSIVSAFAINSNYLLLTNDISSQQQHFYPQSIILNNLAKIQTSPISRKTSFIVNTLKQLYFSENNKIKCPKKVFIISDFQKNTFDFENIIYDTTFFYYLLPINPIYTKNISIDSLWFSSPYHIFNSFDTLVVKIKNNSNDFLGNRKLTLFLNDTIKTYQSFEIKPNSTTEIKITYQNEKKGIINGKVEIEDSPVIYDNTMYFTYSINPKPKVLIIQENEIEYLDNFYSDTTNFDLEITNTDNVNISKLQQYNALVLYYSKEISSGLVSEILNYCKSGGNIIFIPQQKTKLEIINKFISNFEISPFVSVDTSNLKIRKIDLNDKLYKNTIVQIDQNSILPRVFEHYVVKISSDIKKILSLENDDIFLFSKKINKGNIYIFTSDISQKNTDFMLNPISVPPFFNIPYLIKDDLDDYFIIGNNNNIKLKNIEHSEVLKLKNISNNTEYYPQILQTEISSILIELNSEITKAGNYLVLNDNKPISSFSLNYNRNESELEFYNSNELNKIIEKNKIKNVQIIENTGTSLQKNIVSNYKMSNFWKIFIIFAIIFLLSEILIIRHIKI